jgi:hypothetical protein
MPEIEHVRGMSLFWQSGFTLLRELSVTMLLGSHILKLDQSYTHLEK